MMQTAHLLQKPFITVDVVFNHHINIEDVENDIIAHPLNQPRYTFKAEKDSELRVGDYVVVHAQETLKIVQIVEIHDTPKIDPGATFEYKWVISRIDFEAFSQRRVEEKKIARLLSELERIEAENHLQERLEIASSQDADFANLVRDFLKESLQQTQKSKTSKKS